MTGPTGIGSAWPGAAPMVTDTRAPVLDLSAAVGQMTYTWRFELTDAVSGQRLGEITPIRDATLSHDTAMTTKRRLSLHLGRADGLAVNPVTDSLDVLMVIPAAANPDRRDGAWPMGRYFWSANPQRLTTGGRLPSPTLNDRMFVIDQELEAGLNGVGKPVVEVILAAVAGLTGVVLDAEPSAFASADAWGIGSGRGQVLETLATSGDYFSPWFDNLDRLRFLRTFNPANQVPDLNLDAGYRVLRSDIIEDNELLTAPNRFIVISNAASNSDSPCVGVADVPVNAPNSIATIGFVRPKTYQLQLSDPTQAQAVAQGIMQRSTVFETVSLSTPADPRHDGYNVIRWQGANWLELGWSVTCVPGAPMTHTMRKSYAA